MTCEKTRGKIENILKKVEIKIVKVNAAPI